MFNNVEETKDDFLCERCTDGVKVQPVSVDLCEDCVAKILRQEISSDDLNKPRISPIAAAQFIGMSCIKTHCIDEKATEETDRQLPDVISKGIANELASSQIRVRNLEKQIEDMKKEEERYLREINNLRERIQNNTVTQRFRNKLNQIQTLFGSNREDELRKLTNTVQGKEVEKTSDSMARLLDKKFNLIHDFIWIINDFSTRRGKFNSNYFHKTPYSFFLSCYHTGSSDDLFRVSLHITDGYNDGAAEWPMKYSVTINLHDQATLYVHKSAQFSYHSYKNKEAFDRPSSSSNKGIGNLVISGNEIRCTNGLLMGDTILISCILK